jgi:hypothetical protein
VYKKPKLNAGCEMRAALTGMIRTPCSKLVTTCFIGAYLLGTAMTAKLFINYNDIYLCSFMVMSTITLYLIYIFTLFWSSTIFIGKQDLNAADS